MLGNSTDKQYYAEKTVTQYDAVCIGEWNMNYYTDITDIDPALYGTSEPEFYKRFFPLTSVCSGWRPTAGVYKPRGTSGVLSTWQTSSTARNNIFLVASPTSVADEWALNPRLYYANQSQPFKYWDSPVRLGDAAYVDPYIEYVSDVWANKIRVTFNNVAASPTGLSIYFKDTSNTWQLAWTSGGGFSLGSDGVVDIWHTSASNPNTWSSTEPATHDLDKALKLRGIKVVISGMTNAAVHPAIIEISPRVQLDLTDRLKEWSYDANLAENNEVFPVGTVSANTGTLTLSNNDGALEPELAGGSSINYADVMKKNGKITIKYKVNTTGSTYVNSLVAYTDVISMSGNKGTAEIPLFDRVHYLQDAPSPDLNLHDVTPTVAIWSLLDLAGFGGVVIKAVSGQTEPKMRWFYSSSEKTVWAAIQEICASHQYACYMNELDQIVIMTKEYIYASRTAQFVLTSDDVTNGGLNYVPNIKDIKETLGQPVNAVYVTFRPIDLFSANDPDINKNILKSNQVAFSRVGTQTLYRPDSPILLGCSPLAKAMDTTQDYFYIANTALRTASWGQFSGLALIGREIVAYDGLEIAYTPKDPSQPNTAICKSAEDLIEAEDYATGVVTFTGKVCNVKRAQYGTTAEAHLVGLVGWTLSPYAKRTIDSLGNGYLNIHRAGAGAARVTHAYKILTSGSKWVNTRMTILDAKTKCRSAGVVVFAHTTGGAITGLYVEVNQKDGTSSGTVSVYSVSAGIRSAAPLYKVTARVPDNAPFNLSVYFTQATGTNKRLIKVYLNSALIINKVFTSSIAVTNGIALATSGDTSANFDYVAGGNSLLTDEQSKYDGTIRAYINGMLEFDKGQAVTRTIPDLSSIGFERFDDYVRGIYKDDIRFTKAPALDYTFVTTSLTVRDAENLKTVALGKDVAGAVSNFTPFGATIAVANVSSRPMLLVNVTTTGELNYPFMYGPVINEFEQVRINKKDDKSVARNGEMKLDFSPTWINNRSAAENVAQWILDIQKDGVKKLEVDVWANPLLQIGDNVLVYVPEKGINANYVVTGKNAGGSSDGQTSHFALTKV